jgi:hypothetical protein
LLSSVEEGNIKTNTKTLLLILNVMFLNAFVFSTLVPAAVLFSAVLSVGATKQNRDKEYEVSPD